MSSTESSSLGVSGAATHLRLKQLPERRAHISRLPSATLLSYGYDETRLIRGYLKEKCEGDFSATNFADTVRDLSNEVHVEVFRGMVDLSVYILLTSSSGPYANNKYPPNTRDEDEEGPTRASTPPHGGSSSGGSSPSSADVLEKSVTKLLHKLSGLMVGPCQVMRLRCCGKPYRPAKEVASIKPEDKETSPGGDMMVNGVVSSPKEIAVIESFRVKLEMQNEFLNAIETWEYDGRMKPDTAVVPPVNGVEEPSISSSATTKGKRASPSARPALDLATALQTELNVPMCVVTLQDTTATEQFTFLYEFACNDDVGKVRHSPVWRTWRRFLLPYYLDNPVPEHLVVTFNSADYCRVPKPLTEKMDSQSLRWPPKLIDLEEKSECEITESILKADTARFGPHEDFIKSRTSKFREARDLVVSKVPLTGRASVSSLVDIGSSYKVYGMQDCIEETSGRVIGQVYRDYLPGAKDVSLVGDFNNWNTSSHTLTKDDSKLYGDGVWSIFLPADSSNGKVMMDSHSKYKVYCTKEDGTGVYRLPAFATYSVENPDMKVFDAVVWREPYKWEHLDSSVEKCIDSALTNPLIYECFTGVATDREDQIGSYDSVIKTVIPRLKAVGYNTLVIKHVHEYDCYSSAGWHTSALFAVSSRYGTPNQMKELVNAAHKEGIAVLFSVIHSHFGPNEGSGLKEYDGTPGGGYALEGEASYHRMWDAVVPDFRKPQVVRMLLSNLMYFVDEYHVDGFVFEGVSSMLYRNRGIMISVTSQDLSSYWNSNVDLDACSYLMLCNSMLKTGPRRRVITIANEHTGHPGLALPIDEGGLGFDFHLRSHIPDSFASLAGASWKADYNLDDMMDALDQTTSLKEKFIGVLDSFDSTTLGKRPLKIAMFAWETLHTHAVGGVAPHVTELAAALARLGHEVHIFTRSLGVQSNHSIHYGVHYHECPFHLNTDFVAEMSSMCESFIHHMTETEAFMQEAFHICHAHDWLAARALIIAKRLGKTCILTIHSTEYGRCGNHTYGGDSARIRSIEQEACMAADRIICVSGVLAQEVRNLYGVHPEKVRVVYNGCNAQNFDGFEDAGVIKSRYGISALDPTFVFVGRLVVQKGPDLMIEAIPMILKCRSDCKFVVVGDGHMRGELERRINQLGVSHAVKLLGTKGGDELKSLFKMCDAVVVPSRNEPFGIVVLEAWSAYKPVVATTCGGPRDFVTPNTDGYLVDPNPNSIAWGCCEILQNFEHARWMGERGRVKAAYSFSWNNIGMMTRGIYFEQVLKSDAPYCVNKRSDCSLIHKLIGGDIYDHMGIFDPSEKVRQGLGFLKLAQMLVMGLGSSGYMTFMGSEFGHPDWIDLPRASNGFSHFYNKRSWHLAVDKSLKYKHILFYNKVLLDVLKALGVQKSPSQRVLVKHQQDRIVAFQRGFCLFVLNFHPQQSRLEYEISHSIPASKMEIIVNSDNTVFGGCGYLDAHADEERLIECVPINNNNNNADQQQQYLLKLSLPPMTGILLCPDTTPELRELKKMPDGVLCANNTPDTFIDKLTFV